MPDKNIKFLQGDHPRAHGVSMLVSFAREEPAFAKDVVSTATYLVASKALAEGVHDPAEACAEFQRLVELTMLANRKPEGTA
jgi:hypothetical protein